MVAYCIGTDADRPREASNCLSHKTCAAIARFLSAQPGQNRRFELAGKYRMGQGIPATDWIVLGLDGKYCAYAGITTIRPVAEIGSGRWPAPACLYCVRAVGDLRLRIGP